MVGRYMQNVITLHCLEVAGLVRSVLFYVVYENLKSCLPVLNCHFEWDNLIDDHQC